MDEQREKFILPKDKTSEPLQNINVKINGQKKNISFTPRETEILACLVKRDTTREIANLLSLDKRGAEAHIGNIRSKLDDIPKEKIKSLIEDTDKISYIETHFS